MNGSRIPPSQALATLTDPRPHIMGILNTTPDSFSDGGRWSTTDRAVAHAEHMLADGADIIDVGGESSRPGAESVAVDAELDRVIPVIERLADRCVVSIDTAKSDVAEAALRAGAHIVNDITARLEEVAAKQGAGWIAMHMLGEPRTMQDDPRYDEVVTEIADFLEEARARGRAAGVPRTWVDPGIGFGKSTEHNLVLLRDLEKLTSVGGDIAIGVSRKRFIGELHASSDESAFVGTGDRLAGSVLAAVWAMRMGAHIVRVHDVRATVAAARYARI